MPPRAVMYGKQLRKFGETLYTKIEGTVKCPRFLSKHQYAIMCFYMCTERGTIMAGNSGLRNANSAKKDEFYTQLVDIENELRHYKRHFAGKVVLCNCDDPYDWCSDYIYGQI